MGGNEQGREEGVGTPSLGGRGVSPASSNRGAQAPKSDGQGPPQVTVQTDPFALNRAARRRMKKAIKLSHTPSREEASALILAGYRESPYQIVDEPVKVRIPRAWEDRPMELPDGQQ